MLVFSFSFVVLRTEVRVLCILGKSSTNEPYLLLQAKIFWPGMVAYPCVFFNSPPTSMCWKHSSLCLLLENARTLEGDLMGGHLSLECTLKGDSGPLASSSSWFSILRHDQGVCTLSQLLLSFDVLSTRSKSFVCTQSWIQHPKMWA